MPPLTRITITIPEELVRAADVRAAAADRSRSWIIVEALRRGLQELDVVGSAADPRSGAPVPHAYAAPPQPTLAVAEPATVAYERGLGSSRTAQLISDLALSPEERVRAAEETAQFAERIEGPPTKRLMIFNRYEDYLAWNRVKVALR